MGRLTTHVLDTAHGVPAAGVRIDVQKEGSPAPLKHAVTNVNGRTEAPLLEGAELAAGTWRLVFHVGEYFRSRGERDAGRFLEDVPVQFVVEDAAAAYHVPLLVSPWSYSTYRGS